MLKSVHHVPEHLSTMSPDRTEGEGWGEGEHTAQVTLCSLLQNTVVPSARRVSCGGFSLLFFLFLLLVDLQIDDAANLIVVHRQQVVLAHLGDDLR